MGNSGKTILLDTNFLLIPSQFKVDIFAELDRVCDFQHTAAVMDSTVAELKSLSADAGKSLKDRRGAKMALQLLEAGQVAVIKSRKVFKSADKAILEFASANKDVMVATQDRELKRRLKALGVSVAVLRQKSHIVID